MVKKVSLTHERLLELVSYDPKTGLFSRRDQVRGRDSAFLELLRTSLDYDKEIGVFRWKIKPSRNVTAGTEAGSLKPTSSGIYRYISLGGERHLAHRLAWFYVYEEWPRLISFKDGNSTNCSLNNLQDTGRDLPTADASNGYLYLKIDNIDYVAARIAWFWVKGEWPKSLLRFRDGNKANLRFANLRDTGEEPAYGRTDQGRADARKTAYESQRDRARHLSFQRKFGLSLEQYQEMSEKQGHACAICGQPETITRNGKPRLLAVDHCHSSNKVRGLLCGNCNPMIGYAKDSIEVLGKAIEYLNSYKGAA